MGASSPRLLTNFHAIGIFIYVCLLPALDYIVCVKIY